MGVGVGVGLAVALMAVAAVFFLVRLRRRRFMAAAATSSDTGSGWMIMVGGASRGAARLGAVGRCSRLRVQAPPGVVRRNEQPEGETDMTFGETQ